ncbi:hypothetical protein C3L33_02665, partial [Rhododendron williamsianum]
MALPHLHPQLHRHPPHSLPANNNPHLLLLRHCSLNPNQEHFSLRFDDNTFNPYTHFKSPFNSQYFLRVVGTCNGLLCLSDDWFGDKHRVILWNPLIQRYVTLPAPNFTVHAFGPYQSFLGFGFDSLTNNYKVVRVVYPHKLDRSMLHCEISPPKVEVYSLRTRSWKPIAGSVPSCNMVEFFWQHVFVKGAAHWIGYNRRQGEGKTHNVILCFGMGNEAFGKMGLPEAVSWTKLYIVDMPDGIPNVFGFRRSGELLMATRGGDFVSYHRGSKRVEKLGMRTVKGSIYAESYVESLVLLDGMNGDFRGQCSLVDSLEDSQGGQKEEVDEETLERAFNRNFLSAAAFLTGSLLEFLIRN